MYATAQERCVFNLAIPRVDSLSVDSYINFISSYSLFLIRFSVKQSGPLPQLCIFQIWTCGGMQRVTHWNPFSSRPSGLSLRQSHFSSSAHANRSQRKCMRRFQKCLTRPKGRCGPLLHPQQMRGGLTLRMWFWLVLPSLLLTHLSPLKVLACDIIDVAYYVVHKWISPLMHHHQVGIPPYIYVCVCVSYINI